MKTRQTMILGVSAVLMLGAALWLSSARRPTSEAPTVKSALPGLDAKRLNAIDKVTLTGAGGKVVATLKREDSGWSLVERNYPADAGKLRELLLTLVQSKRIEEKTSNEKLYAKLGVEDVSAEKAGGIELKLEGGGEPLSLILGQNPPSGKGSYVRGTGESSSWLIDHNIAIERNAPRWLQQALVDVATDRIESVVMTPATGAKIEIVPSSGTQGDFKLGVVPKGREQATDFVADATAGLLQGLNLEDVAAADAQPVDAKTQRKTAFVLKDGVSYAMESWEQDGKTWARFTASIDQAKAQAAIAAAQAKAKTEWEAAQAAAAKDAQAAKATTESKPAEPAAEPAAAPAAQPEPAVAASDEPKPTAEAPLAVRDPAADALQRLQALTDAVNAANARFTDRVFQLPTYKASNLNRDLEAYLKPLSKP